MRDFRDVLLWPIPALFLVADYLQPAAFLALGFVLGLALGGLL